MSSASALEAGPNLRKGGRETADEDAEVFWDGGLRQTVNAHVEVGHNREGGRHGLRL